MMSMLGLSDAPRRDRRDHPDPPPPSRGTSPLTSPPGTASSRTPSLESSCRCPPTGTRPRSRWPSSCGSGTPPCARSPGCTRSVGTFGEMDHIEEFDHRHPEQGGPTSIENLHRLCGHHHQLKTFGLIDVERNADGTSTWTVDDHRICDVEDTVDLLTPDLAADLLRSWEDLIDRRFDRELRAVRHAYPPTPNRPNGCGCSRSTSTIRSPPTHRNQNQNQNRTSIRSRPAPRRRPAHPPPF